MKFLETIKNSIYSPNFYEGILKKPFKESIVYFLLLSLLLTTIHILTFAGPVWFGTRSQIQNFTAAIALCYPNDLEIKITNGIASSSAYQPYIIPPCNAFDEGIGETIVIDTQTPFSPEKFKEYNAALWVTKDAVVYKKNDYETKSYSFAQVKDFKLNREVIDSFYDTYSPWLKFVGPVLLFFSFIGIYLSYDFRLIYLLIIALIVWLASRAFKQSLSYGQAYKVGLYAVTLGLIVELIIDLTRPWTNFHGFPFMFTIITLAVVSLNLLLPKKGQAP